MDTTSNNIKYIRYIKKIVFPFLTVLFYKQMTDTMCQRWENYFKFQLYKTILVLELLLNLVAKETKKYPFQYFQTICLSRIEKISFWFS